MLYLPRMRYNYVDTYNACAFSYTPSDSRLQYTILLDRLFFISFFLGLTFRVGLAFFPRLGDHEMHQDRQVLSVDPRDCGFSLARHV